ncbi:hypothetical protein AB4179_14080 [Vibrio lentus]|jgi:hypothetical protein|nr:MULTISPECIES: hypothetical protein [Vibrio]MDN3629230.1 hypothetical protein [Vibrio lentus]
MDSIVVIRVALFVTDVIAKAVFVIVLLIWREFTPLFFIDIGK